MREKKGGYNIPIIIQNHLISYGLDFTFGNTCFIEKLFEDTFQNNFWSIKDLEAMSHDRKKNEKYFTGAKKKQSWSKAHWDKTLLLRSEKWEFYEKWGFENVNFDKNETLKMWIFVKYDFCPSVSLEEIRIPSK